MDQLEGAVEISKADLVIMVGNNLSIEQYDQHSSILENLRVPVIVGGRLALNLLKEGRQSTTQLEFTPLRPGPLARLIQYKLTTEAASLL